MKAIKTDYAKIARYYGRKIPENKRDSGKGIVLFRS